MDLTFGILSDTHGWLSPEVLHYFEGVDAIFHCGDIGCPTVISDLETIAPTYAVHGNMDPYEITIKYPDQLSVVIANYRISLTHGHLFPSYPPNPKFMVLKFGHLNPDLLLYGHTHSYTWMKYDNVYILNPGSASRPKQRNEKPTICLIRLNGLKKWEIEKIYLTDMQKVKKKF